MKAGTIFVATDLKDSDFIITDALYCAVFDDFFGASDPRPALIRYLKPLTPAAEEFLAIAKAGSK
jgi:hypothetical protein